MKHARLLRPTSVVSGLVASGLAASALLGAPPTAAAQDAPPPDVAPAPAAAPEPAPAPAPPAPPAAPETAAPDVTAPAPPAAAAAAQPFQVSVGDVQISGDQFEMDPATGLITVSGNPRAVRGDEEIRATRMIINPRTLQFTAEGDVIIRQGGRELRSTRATYNFQQKAGQAESVETLIKAYNVEADQIIIKPGPAYEARRAKFSTCDREHKHYEVYSRVLDIVPGEELVARNAAVDFMGVRLVTVPRLRKSLREGADDDNVLSLIPTFGYDSRNGPYARDDFNLVRGGPLWIDAELQVNTFREPQGGFLFGTPGKIKFVGSLYYRDNAPNQRAPHLQVSRLPELGVVWSSKEEVRPGRFLGDRIQSVTYPKALDISTSWIFAAQATAGFFRQHHGDRLVERDGRSKNGGRFSILGQAVLPLVKLGPASLNDLRLLVRNNTYDNGDNFTTMGFGLGKRFDIGRHWRVRADYFHQFTMGKTPFLFDDVELRKEIRPAIEYRSRGFEFAYMARIDAQDGQVFDHRFEISKLFHCIKPTLSYSTRRNEFFVEIRIPGLSGGASTAPGEPRSTETAPDRRLPLQPEPQP